MSTETNWDDYEEEDVATSGKRCGVQWAPWMGDWFSSSSPRNGNNNAEGPWDHWVDLALKILSDPLTKIVRPDAFMDSPTTFDFYSEANRTLTSEELIARFPQRREQIERQDAWHAKRKKTQGTES